MIPKYKVPYYWILVILLVGSLAISVIDVGVENNSETNSNRPLWLVGPEDVNETLNLEMDQRVDDKYFISFSTMDRATVTFSIDTRVFDTNEIADDFVSAKKHELDVISGLEVIFPNELLDLSVVENGYAWQIKSPCCFSRGVTFAIENVFIHIFGSQKSNFDQINDFYTRQVVKLYNYFNLQLPENFLAREENNILYYISGAIILAIPLIVIFRRRIRI